MLGSSKLLFDRATELTQPGLELLVSVIIGILVVALFQYVQTAMKKRSLKN